MDINTFIEYFNAHDRGSASQGIRLTAIGHGTAEAEMEFCKEVNSNFMGAMHGGALSTLADIVGGCCTFDIGRPCVTLSNNMSYLRGIRGGRAIAKARLVRQGGRICYCQVEIFDDEGNLCCTSAIMMYLLNQSMEGMPGFAEWGL